jgi:hypothetical protein
LGERLLCKQEAVGSIPTGSTTPAARTTYSFTTWPKRQCLLFKNPEEVLFLTLSFQAKLIVLFNSLENVAFAM